MSHGADETIEGERWHISEDEDTGLFVGKCKALRLTAQAESLEALRAVAAQGVKLARERDTVGHKGESKP